MDDVDAKSLGRGYGKAPGVGLRGLVLGWSLWLLGTWIVLWAVGGWTMPALRVMVLAGLVGMMGVWPAVRLSQWTGPRAHPRPRKSRKGREDVTAGDTGTEVPEPRGSVHSGGGEVSGRAWAGACVGVLGDWLALNLIFQAVLWPLQLAARWTVTQTAWLVLAVAGWSLLTGLIIAWGRGTNRAGWRSWAMVACVGVVVLEPMLWWLGWVSGGQVSGLGSGGVGLPEMRFSPLQAVWGVSQAGTAARAQAAVGIHGFQIVTVTVAAVVGWIVLWVLLGVAMWRERKSST